MNDDPSGGWEAVAAKFSAMRSDVGADVVKRWSRRVRPGGSILDIGCGAGRPIATTLLDEGFDLYGIDPSPTLLAAFRRNLPGAEAACEAAEVSRLFDRRFDGAVAIGVMFLLSKDGQRAVIERVGRALTPGGHFLFSAPRQPCCWKDTLTGRLSLSLARSDTVDCSSARGCASSMATSTREQTFIFMPIEHRTNWAGTYTPRAKIWPANAGV